MTTPRGEVPEWLNGAVSKTVVVLWATVGSNPTLSAISLNEKCRSANAERRRVYPGSGQCDTTRRIVLTRGIFRGEGMGFILHPPISGIPDTVCDTS